MTKRIISIVFALTVLIFNFSFGVYNINKKEPQKNEERLIQLGDIVLYKENNKEVSYCIQRDEVADYQGIHTPEALKVYFSPPMVRVLPVTI